MKTIIHHLPTGGLNPQANELFWRVIAAEQAAGSHVLIKTKAGMMVAPYTTSNRRALTCSKVSPVSARMGATPLNAANLEQATST